MYELNNLNYRTTYYGIYTGQLGFVLYKCLYYKLVFLNHWIQLADGNDGTDGVVICFQISIFEPLNTAEEAAYDYATQLWFAFKLVSLNHWIQHLVWGFFMPNSCDLLSN